MEIYKFAANNNKYHSQLCLGSIFKDFNTSASHKIYFKGNVDDFTVTYNSIEYSQMLNIKQNNIWTY